MSPTEKDAVGIYGGSFNPIHTGHIHAATQVRGALGLSKIVLIPSATPPHKQKPEGTPHDKMRLKMCRIAVKDIPFIEVSGIEIERGGVSYTIDTLEALKACFSGPLWFIVGTDMFLSLEKWRRFGDIARLCSFAVLPRSSEDMPMLLRHARFLNETYGLSSRVIDAPPIEISSTELRVMLKNGGGQRYLPPDVYDFIRENGLYGVRHDLAPKRGD